MVFTRAGGFVFGMGSDGSDLSEDDIHNLMDVEIAAFIKKMMLDMFGSIKIKLITMFNERYAVLTSVVTVYVARIP